MVVVDTDAGSVGEREVETADVAIVAYSCDDQASLERWASLLPPSLSRFIHSSLLLFLSQPRIVTPSLPPSLLPPPPPVDTPLSLSTQPQQHM